MIAPAIPRARPARRAYVAIALLMALIAVAGFWPTYFGRVAASDFEAPWFIHLHALVFGGWLAIVVAQAWLAARGRLALHRRFGQAAFAYGGLVLLVGWLTALLVFRERVLAADPQRASVGLFVPLTDLLFFAPTLVAAWGYRGRPEVHKRLIVVATTVLLIAGAHRLVGAHVGRPPPLAPVLLVWLSPVLVGMGVDWSRRRVVHPVYLVGVGVVLLMKFRPRLHTTAAWESFTSALARMLT